MTDARTFDGGCFCGAARYRFTSVFDAGDCHCSMERLFCNPCGTIVLSRAVDASDRPYASIHHVTIDRASEILPAIHICFADRSSWFGIDDALPRVDDNMLPHPDRRARSTEGLPC